MNHGAEAIFARTEYEPMGSVPKAGHPLVTTAFLRRAWRSGELVGT